MSNYVIFSDSGCDVSGEMFDKWGVKRRSLTFIFTDSAMQYSNDDMPVKAFYDKMRAGGVAKTSAVNTDTFVRAFEEELIAGNDILYIGFSTGLSTTANSAAAAAQTLKSRYPERRIIAIDTLCASGGEGLIVYLAVLQKRAGKTIDEVADYVKDIMMNVCHWFTVEDLTYLKRGGRISAATAVVGSLLGIKPVLHVDDGGRLVSMFKVRGRKASIRALADKYGELCINRDMPVFISHGDCEDEAKALADILKRQHGAKDVTLTYIGPVIGAHAGPGTIALFFIGKER